MIAFRLLRQLLYTLTIVHGTNGCEKPKLIKSIALDSIRGSLVFISRQHHPSAGKESKLDSCSNYKYSDTLLKLHVKRTYF